MILNQHFRIGSIKKKLPGFILLVILSSLASTTLAANEEALLNAFKRSYQAETNGKFSDGISILKTVYSADDYQLNMRLGWLTYLGGFFTESSSYYQKAINLRKYSIEAKLGKAYPLSVMGNWNEIEQLYNEILELDPKNSLTLYRMGSISYGRKDYKQAEKYLELILNLYPMDYNSLSLFAWTKLQLGKKKEAFILFQQVLQLSPDDASALEGLKAIGG